MNRRDLMVARNVETAVGGAMVVVCGNFEGGTGNIHELVVFDKCQLSVGDVDIVHLLHTTELEEGTGAVGKFDYCEPEALLDLAYRLSGIPKPGAKKKPKKDEGGYTINIQGGIQGGGVVIGDNNDVSF